MTACICEKAKGKSLMWVCPVHDGYVNEKGEFMTHTVTPWIAELSTIYSLPLQKEKEENDAEWTDGSIVCSVINKADAAFIVRAVNAHEELLSLLKNINEFLSEGMSLSPNALIDDCEEAETFAQAVKQAIAKAEGK